MYLQAYGSYAQMNGFYAGIDIFTRKGERDNDFTLLITHEWKFYALLNCHRTHIHTGSMYPK